jgi:hypothetical protein
MNRNIKILIFISLFLLLKITYSQNNNGNSIVKLQTENSNKEYKEEKNYWLPAGEILVINTLVLLKARFMEDEDWSKISFKSIDNNFKKGFVWDDNTFGMNQFLHPYHGSAYFNSARSNGLSFWESAPYAFGGSLIWEAAFEVELPAYNDLINTTLSGIILGEITYRMSSQIIDESTIGFERFTREFTAFLINPIRGLNRLVEGKMWYNGTIKKKPKLFTRLSIGVNTLFQDRKLSNNNAYFLLGLDMDYGNKFSTSAHKKPFDYLKVHSEFSFVNGDNIIGISANGVLWDWKFKAFNTNNNVAGLYKEFDYLENIVYKFTATSLAGELTNKTMFSKTSSLQSSVALSGIFLGGTNSIYSKEVLMNYNLGPGLGMRIMLDAQLSDALTLNFKYKQFWIYIVNGLSGNEFIGLFNIEMNYKIFKNNSLGLSLVLYERYGVYSDYPDEYSENASARIFSRICL